MQGSLFRFYVHEGHRHHGRLVWEWLLEEGNKLGIRGGSAFKAMAGFGRHHVLHEARFFELAGTLTVEVEFIVTEEECSSFWNERRFASSTPALRRPSASSIPIRPIRPHETESGPRAVQRELGALPKAKAMRSDHGGVLRAASEPAARGPRRRREHAQVVAASASPAARAPDRCRFLRTKRMCSRN